MSEQSMASASTRDSRVFAERFGSISDPAWLELLIRSIDEPTIDGVEFPRFPDEKMQSNSVGLAGRATLEEAFVFYQDIKRNAARLGIPLNAQSKVLDFGCGWGRNYRFFLRELLPANYVGIDIDADCIATCKRTNPYGNFERCEIAPPVRFAAGSLDVVYAYSVFSHLSEGAHLQWIGEFGRVLRPGGMLIVTTLKRDHLGVWMRLGEDEKHPWWKENMRRIEFEINKFAAFYDSGEKFLYSPTGGGGIRTGDFYGEAIVSPAYIRRAWSKEFELVEHQNDRADAPQALIVCRRR